MKASTRRHLQKKAEEAGHKAGLRGDPATACPYERGDVELLSWLAGWVKGDKQRQESVPERGTLKEQDGERSST